MPKMTKAQTTVHNALLAKCYASNTAVFSASPRTDVKFTDCLDMSSPDVVAEYHHVQQALRDYEAQLVQAGRGYRDTFGHFQPYLS